MNELKVFTNDKFGTIRTVELEGTAYFVGKDLAEILGYSNINKAIQVHVDEEDKKILNFKGFSHFVTNLWEGNDFSNKTLINESGRTSREMAALLNVSAPTYCRKRKYPELMTYAEIKALCKNARVRVADYTDGVLKLKGE